MEIQEKVLEIRKRFKKIKKGVARYRKTKKLDTYRKVRDEIDDIYSLIYWDSEMNSVISLYAELGSLSQELERILEEGEW